MQPVVEGKNWNELSRSNIWNTFLQSSISCSREFVNLLRFQFLLLPPRPILNRLGQMRRGDFVIPGQICNRPRDFEDTMKRSRR